MSNNKHTQKITNCVRVLSFETTTTKLKTIKKNKNYVNIYIQLKLINKANILIALLRN